MDRPFELRQQDGRVFYEGTDKLDLSTILVAVNRALNKRKRDRGWIDPFLYNLRRYGHAELEWAFVRRIYKSDDHLVQFASRAEDYYYILECTGPRAVDAIEAINDKLAAPRKRNKQEKTHEYQVKHQRKQEKRKRHRKKYAPAPAQVKQKKIRDTAAFSLKTKDIVWQMQHNVVSWDEMVDATIAVFGIRAGSHRLLDTRTVSVDAIFADAENAEDWKHRTRDRVAARLFRSLDMNGSFCQVRFEGFVLRFDLLESDKDFSIREEKTRFTIACTKDRMSLYYSRVRKYFKPRLIGLSSGEAAARRDLLKTREINFRKLGPNQHWAQGAFDKVA